jgi:hypothetical protein
MTMHFRPSVMATAILTMSICPTIAFAQNSAPVQHEATVAQFDPDDFVSLDARPGGQFADVPVESASGARIGTVRIVGLAPDGSAARVLVGLYSGGSVWIVADALRYNRNARILLTNLKHIESSVDREPF